jgi:hypothetical protein
VDAGKVGGMDDVFGLIDPADVHCVFLSHDDVDHTGNLAQVMEHCPNATPARASLFFSAPGPRCTPSLGR